MPAAVLPAIISGVAAGSWFAGGSLVVGFSWLSFGSSLVLSGLGKLVGSAKKSGGASAGQQGITQTIRQAAVPRKPVYGEMRVGGALVFFNVTGSNEYLHMIVALAPHEVAEIGEIWLDNYSIPADYLDSSGNVTQGLFSGVCRIKKHLGVSGQTADSDFVAENANVDTNFRGQGIAYIYVRLKWDQSKWPNGLPNISAWVRGKKLYDPRTTNTVFSQNIALIANDYLQDPTFGFNASSAMVDQTFLAASANTCDEFVTTNAVATNVSAIDAATGIITLVTPTIDTVQGVILNYIRGDQVQVTTTGTLPTGIAAATNYYVIPYQRGTTPRIQLAASYADALAGTAITISDAGTGTHTVTKNAEPRYDGAYLVDTSRAIGSNMTDILTGMGGQLVFTGGKYLIQAAAYQTPTVYFDENDIIGAMTINTKLSARERFNKVQGTYISPVFDGQSVDYPEVTNTTYITQDGYEIRSKIDYPITQRPGTCQRLSKIALERMRQEISWSADFSLTALQVRVGDTAYFSNVRMGWTDKVFEIVSWKMAVRTDANGVAVPYITLGLRETASGVYNWSNGEETTVNLAPNTTLPDPFTVAAPTGLAANSEKVMTTTTGSYVYKILVSWNAVADQFVSNGGRIEISYKKSSDSTWRPTYYVPGDTTFTEVTLAAQLNTDYDIRVRSVNSFGIPSSWSSILGYIVGSSGGVGTTNDWGDFVSTPATTQDWGDFISTPSTTQDWGYYT